MISITVTSPTKARVDTVMGEVAREGLEEEGGEGLPGGRTGRSRLLQVVTGKGQLVEGGPEETRTGT